MSQEYGSSHIENLFRAAWHEIGNPFPLIEQYKILGGRFRPDFVHLETMSAIELDGAEYHTGQANWEKDHLRQRELEKMGWRFTRFAGRSIVKDAKGCAEIASNFILRGIAEQERQGQLNRQRLPQAQIQPRASYQQKPNQQARPQNKVPVAPVHQVQKPFGNKPSFPAKKSNQIGTFLWCLAAIFLISQGIFLGIGLIQPWFYCLIFLGIIILVWRFEKHFLRSK